MTNNIGLANATADQQNEWALTLAYESPDRNGEDSFGLISAAQPNAGADENRSNSARLCEIVSSFPGTRLDGCRMDPNDPEKIESIEDYFWVDTISLPELLTWAREFKQEFVIYCGPESAGDVTFFALDGTILKALDGFSPGDIAAEFGILKKCRFTFRWHIENWIGGMGYEAGVEGLLKREQKNPRIL